MFVCDPLCGCISVLMCPSVYFRGSATSRTSSYSSRPWHSMKLRAAVGISSVRFHRALRANFRVESTTPTMAFCCTIASSCCETEQMSGENVRRRGVMERYKESVRCQKKMDILYKKHPLAVLNSTVGHNDLHINKWHQTYNKLK